MLQLNPALEKSRSTGISPISVKTLKTNTLEDLLFGVDWVAVISNLTPVIRASEGQVMLGLTLLQK